VSVFCLVHGSTQGPSGWNLLTAELEKRGHITITPDLPTDDPGASGTFYAGVIAQTLHGFAAEDLIVVAHSAGGIFLPLLADLRPVQHIVFLAAVVPNIGESIMDQAKRDPTMLCPDWVGVDPTTSDELAHRFLFHDCAPDVAAWALTTIRRMLAVQAMREACPLAKWPAVATSYILCSEDRTITPAWARRIAREHLGITPIELSGGHCPHVSRPSELADTLITISQAVPI
jgi:hypothetical protein